MMSCHLSCSKGPLLPTYNELSPHNELIELLFLLEPTRGHNTIPKMIQDNS